MRLTCRTLLSAAVLPMLIAGCGEDPTLPRQSGPGPPAELQIRSGNGQADTVFATVPQALVVKVVDSAGVAVPQVKVRWVASSEGGRADPVETVSDSAGETATSWSLGAETGEQTIRAEADAIFVEFSALARPGRAAAVLASRDSVQLTGIADTATLIATVTDAHGNVREEDPVDWESSDSAVVAVEPSGILLSWSPGDAVVSARSGELHADVFVSVQSARDEHDRILFGLHNPSAGETWLYAIRSDGSGLELVDSIPSSWWDWSPDGQAITYMRFVNGSYQMVWKSFGAKDADIFFDGSGYGPTWSPDSRAILYQTVGETSLKVYSPSTAGTETIVTDHVNRFTGYGPDWSPSGDRVAWSSYVDSTFQIYSISRDGADRRKLTGLPYEDRSSPLFSPDGRWIAFHSPGLSVVQDSAEAAEQMLLSVAATDQQWMSDSRRLITGTQSGSIWLVDITGGSASEILGDSVYQARWSPDESTLAYIIHNKGLWIMNADGSDPRMILGDSNVRGWLRWQPKP